MSMRKDMQHILSRIDALNEQRHFLNDQLKQVLKRSKVLESEIDNATATNAVKSQILHESNLENTENFGNTENMLLDTNQNLATYMEKNLNNENGNHDEYNIYNKILYKNHTTKDLNIFDKSKKLIKSSTAPHRLQSPPKQIPIKIIKDVLITSKLSKNQSDDFDTSRDPGSQLEFLLSHRYHLSIVLYLSYVHRY